MKNTIIPITLSGLFVLSTAATGADPAYPIAGTAPYQRPAGAPVIEWVQHDRAWFEHALTGIQRPYPRSLYFLDNQGNWYTPFTRPGMTPPYDLRGWHQ
ncbi:MAG TPA: hypothetical protein ENJ12_10105 [Thiolapillus brandeum]|uniref:Uncharacterized protein n=1 Tax=Thiolapillus brandeum TaxID=1076588 RepID=A0A831RXR6_9GAMM|nr:hypothetical protein [Thiolapillus brandeum]